jgi:antitoxin HicB
MDFPAPTPARRGEYVVAPPAEMIAKAALYTAMAAAGISKVELARRMGINEKEVRRMLDPRHGTKLARLGEAIRALGGRLVIGLDQKVA